MKTGALTLFLGLTVLLPSGYGQEEERIRRLFEDAILKLGGEAFLDVRDMVSEGNYFMFNIDGNSSGLIKFLDYTKLPDKSRFELGNSKKSRDVTVFNLERNEGWVQEGQKETRPATSDEMKDFKNAAKHSLDNILRFRWKDKANRLFYMGPGPGADVRFELVKLVDPENDEVTVYFDRMGGLPVKLEYRTVNRRGVLMRMVQEFSQWHETQKIKTPLRTDTLTNGRLSSQTYITKITYNSGLGDATFAKPVPPK